MSTRHAASTTHTRSRSVALAGRGQSCAAGRTTRRVEVRAAAFEALAYVGLDDDAARVAVEGLESDEPPVRAMAAYALRGWQGARRRGRPTRRTSRRYVGGRRPGRANASVDG